MADTAQKSHNMSITFTTPYTHVLSTAKLNSHCAFCFAKPQPAVLARCGRCRMVRYCSKACQVADWKLHKPECHAIATREVGLPVPPTELRFFLRLCEKRRRDTQKLQNTEDIMLNGQILRRSFDSLLPHCSEIRQDETQMKYFNALKVGLQSIAPSLQLDDDTLFLLFCRKIINTHDLSDNRGINLGQSLDLAISAFDHSCRPNVAIVYTGRVVTFRALHPGLDIKDTAIARVSYTELLATKADRKADLRTKYYFECNCERCESKEDDVLDAFRCPNASCEEPLYRLNDVPASSNLRRDQGVDEPDVPVTATACSVCGAEITQDWFDECEASRQRLNEFLQKTTNNASLLTKMGGKYFEFADGAILDGEKYLHKLNVVLNELKLNYVSRARLMLLNLETAIIYGLEAMACLKVCYPPNYKNLAFHLLKISICFISLLRPAEALPYVKDANRIFNVWFGEEHVYSSAVKELRTTLEERDDAVDLTVEEAARLIQMIQLRDTNEVVVNSGEVVVNSGEAVDSNEIMVNSGEVVDTNEIMVNSGEVVDTNEIMVNSGEVDETQEEIGDGEVLRDSAHTVVE